MTVVPQTGVSKVKLRKPRRIQYADFVIIGTKFWTVDEIDIIRRPWVQYIDSALSLKGWKGSPRQLESQGASLSQSVISRDSSN